MLTRIRIRTRLALSFGFLVLMLVFSGALTVNGIVTVGDEANELERIEGVSEAASETRRLVLQLRRYEKDMIINIDKFSSVDSYKKRLDEDALRLKKTLQSGASLTKRQDIRELYDQAEESLDKYIEGIGSLYSSIRAGEVTETAGANTILMPFKDHTYNLDVMAEKMAIEAKSDAVDAANNIDELVKSMKLMAFLFSALFIITGIALALVVTKSIVEPIAEALRMTNLLADGDLTHTSKVDGQDETAQLLNAMSDTNKKLAALILSLNESSKHVFNGARQIYEDSNSLSARTDSQASALQQTAASIEEITASALQARSSTANAREMASQAVVFAKSGGSDVHRSIELMRELSGSSKRISDIITQLDAITFQTNLLALNASVEAARAGDQGRGFAVVASEVRNLASGSSSLAGEIRTLIEDIVLKIDKGSQQALQTGESINKTIGSIENLSVLVSEVFHASEEQHEGIGQVNLAVSQLDSATQQNSQMVDKSQSQAKELEEQASIMDELVSRFKV